MKPLISSKQVDRDCTILYFNYTKYDLTIENFEPLREWLKTKADGSIYLDFSHLGDGQISICRNPVMSKRTKIESVVERVRAIIESHSVSFEAILG